VFNLLGVVLMWPLVNRLTHFLERRFRTSEEDEARPHHLDANVLGVPTLALDALHQEVRRMGVLAIRMLRDAAGGETQDKLARTQRAIVGLNHAIADFVMRLSRTEMSAASAQRLPDILRIARYYETLSELAVELSTALRENTTPVPVEVGKFNAQAEALLEEVDPDSTIGDRLVITQTLDSLEAHYQSLKSHLLAAGARGELPVMEMESRLRAASMMRRAIEQAVKAAVMLGDGPTPHDIQEAQP
jgi:phosphate:Na+ symporter